MDANYFYMGYPGYSSSYVWAVADACGYAVGGIDANEVLGTNYVSFWKNWWAHTGLRWAIDSNPGGGTASPQKAALALAAPE